MLIKLLAIALLAVTAARVLLGARWQGLGRWIQRMIDLTLVAIAIALGLQLLLFALR